MTRPRTPCAGPLRRGGHVSVFADGEPHPGEPAAMNRTASGVDEHLARELVHGLMRSAIARGDDPATRLSEFRTLQQGVIAVSREFETARTAEQLVRAVDLCLRKLATSKS